MVDERDDGGEAVAGQPSIDTASDGAHSGAGSDSGRKVPDHLSPAVIARDGKGRVAGRQALTPKEEKLATLLASGVPTGEAGRLAGYKDAAASAARAKRSPAVQERIRQMLTRRMQKGASLAIKVVEDILTGKIDAPASVRLDAAKHVQRVAGIDGGAEKDKNNKSLREMTLAELEALAAAFRAKGGGGTVPDGTGSSAQVIDVEVESTT